MCSVPTTFPMPYCAVQLERIPRLSADVVIATRNITVATAERVPDPSVLPQRIFLETPAPAKLSGSLTRAAYVDLRPSKRYPQLRIGTMCRISNIYPDDVCRFSVEARAFADEDQLGGEALAGSYDEARSLALSWLDYSGNWLGADWFEGAPTLNKAVIPYEKPQIIAESELILPSDSPAIRLAKQQRNESIWQQIRSMDGAGDSDLSLFLGHLASQIRISEGDPSVSETMATPASDTNVRMPASLTSQEWTSLWTRLSREIRGLCRLRGRNFSCIATDQSILARRAEPFREMLVRITGQGISISCQDQRVIFEVVKSIKRSLIFEGPERISSIPAFATWLIRFLVGGDG